MQPSLCDKKAATSAIHAYTGIRFRKSLQDMSKFTVASAWGSKCACWNAEASNKMHRITILKHGLLMMSICVRLVLQQIARPSLLPHLLRSRQRPPASFDLVLLLCWVAHCTTRQRKAEHWALDAAMPKFPSAGFFSLKSTCRGSLTSVHASPCIAVQENIPSELFARAPLMSRRVVPKLTTWSKGLGKS